MPDLDARVHRCLTVNGETREVDPTIDGRTWQFSNPNDCGFCREPLTDHRREERAYVVVWWSPSSDPTLCFWWKDYQRVMTN